MITEDYVSFETSKLLKEKGFMDGAIVKFFASGYDKYGNILPIQATELNDYPRPTLQMAMKWLRKIYKLEIRSTYDYDKDSWWGNINPMFEETDENSDIYQKTLKFDYQGKSYEEACDTSIKYCLENLI